MNEITRYIVNGLIATGVHYGVLTINIEVLYFSSAGIANLVAAFFGITSSFLGNRYYVFRNTGESIFTQAVKFSGMYGAIAVMHGTVLLVWTDRLGHAYGIGFLIATFLQVILSYIGNKKLVFST